MSNESEMKRRLREAEVIIERYRQALEAARIRHYVSEDCWYTCPMSDEECCDDRVTECNCGADEHNAAIDAALAIGLRR